MARLTGTVHVHESDGQVVIYNAGDEVPAKHAKLITNPKVWEGEAPAAETAAATGGTASEGTEADAETIAAKAKADAAQADADKQAATVKEKATSGGAGSSEPVKPPAVGNRSGQKPWSEYAKALGLGLPDDASKGAIIEAVTAHEATKAQGA